MAPEITIVSNRKTNDSVSSRANGQGQSSGLMGRGTMHFGLAPRGFILRQRASPRNWTGVGTCPGVRFPLTRRINFQSIRLPCYVPATSSGVDPDSICRSRALP
jgi:hypothetical protein